MTTYDIVMLLIVVGMAIQGAWRGLAWQVAPVASLILGYMVAGPVSPSLAPLFGDPPLADVLALIAVYVAVSLAVYLMIRSVKESLEKLKLAEFDKHLGFLLGAVKGVILTVVVTVLLITVSPAARQMILQTESHSIARLIIGEALPLMPETFRNTLSPYLREFQTDSIAYRNDDNSAYSGNRSRPAVRPSPARPEPGELTDRGRRSSSDVPAQPVSQGSSSSRLTQMWDQLWGQTANPGSETPAARPSQNTPANNSRDRFRNYDPYGGSKNTRENPYSAPTGSSADDRFAPPRNYESSSQSNYRSEPVRPYSPVLWGDNAEGGDAPLFDASSVTRDFVRDQVIAPAVGRMRDELDRSIRESWPDSFNRPTSGNYPSSSYPSERYPSDRYPSSSYPSGSNSTASPAPRRSSSGGY